MKLINDIRQKAKENYKKVVLPEGTDERTIRAAAYLKENNLVEPILLGDGDEIAKIASTLNINIDGVTVINPANSVLFEAYADSYHEMRKHKGMTAEKAREIMLNPLYFGAMMVKKGEVASGVAGAVNTTGNVLSAAFQIIRTASGVKVVSSSFLMVMPDDKVFTFGDCAVIPDPNPEELAAIAISSARTHEMLTGEKAKVAMLSFSTKGSATHPLVDKVISAVEIAKQQAPELEIDGELQFDAAYLESVGSKKAPGSNVAGKANVFIFPDLNAGNIGYKLVQRLAGAEAVGPVIQGLAMPFNDLSRGCSTDDIINMACICSLLAK